MNETMQNHPSPHRYDTADNIAIKGYFMKLEQMVEELQEILDVLHPTFKRNLHIGVYSNDKQSEKRDTGDSSGEK